MEFTYYKDRSKSYWQVVSTLSIKNVKLRYKNSFLGFFWSLLTPLIYLVIFIFIFSQVQMGIENYPLFAIIGLIFWNFFSTTSNQILTSFVDGAGILKSVNLPPIIFPISAISASLINLLLSFIPFFILMFIFGFRPSWNTLLIIPFLISFSVFTFGFSLILGTFNVFFRDVGMLWSSLMPALFYLTPIAFSSTLLPENLKWVMDFNPLFHYIEMVRDILYYDRFPQMKYLVSTSALSLFFLILGAYIFRKLKPGFISNF
ncbi:MAG TPA: ABC transporter permease [Cytophagaceae bacterium]